MTGMHDGETEGTGSYTTEAITIGKTAHALRELPQSVSVITQQSRPHQVQIERTQPGDIPVEKHLLVGGTATDQILESVQSRGDSACYKLKRLAKFLDGGLNALSFKKRVRRVRGKCVSDAGQECPKQASSLKK